MKRKKFTGKFISKWVLFAFFTLSSLFSQSQTIRYVNDAYQAGDVFTLAVGNNSNLGTAESPYATIAFAISQSSAGDVIKVDAGTYSENITVNKRLTINGAGISSTIIAAATANVPSITVSGSGASLSDRLVISDLKVTGATGAVNSGAGILFQSGSNQSNLTVQNVNASFNGGLGIGFNATPAITDVKIVNCIVNNNGSGGGLRIASAVTSFTGLLVDGCTIANNFGGGFNYNPSGPVTNVGTDFTLTNTTFTGNGTGGAANTHDLSFYAFKGNAILSNITLTAGNGSSSNSSSHGIVFDGLVTSTALGTVSLSNVTVQGFVGKGAILFQRYSEISNVSLTDVDLSNCVAPWGQLILSHGDADPFALGNTTLKTLVHWSTGGTDATSAVFKHITSNATLSRSVLADCFQIEDQVVHKVDNGGGFARVKQGQVYVTPSSFSNPYATPSIQRGIDAASAGDVVNVAAGSFSENITISKLLTIQGAGPANTTISAATAGSVFTITGSGVSSSNRITLKDLRVTGASGDGVSIAPPSAGGYYSFDNILANNNNNGIHISGTAAVSDVEVINSTLSNNTNAGLRVASACPSLTTLNVSGCSISNNQWVGFDYNPSGLNNIGTDFNFSNTIFDSNCKSNGNSAGMHDVSIWGFKGNLSFTDVTIISNHTVNGHGLVISPGTLTGIAAGTINIDGLTISGTVPKSAFYIGSYNDLSGFSLNDVDISAVSAGNRAGWGGTAQMVVEATGTNKLNLGNTTLKTLTLWNAAGATATSANFKHISTGTLLDRTVLADCYQIENQVIHSVDAGVLGFVRIKPGNVYVTSASGSIQRGINAATAGDIVNVAAGTFIEQPTISKSVKLYGANKGISAVTGTRNSESVIKNYVFIESDLSGVEIDGFEFTDITAEYSFTIYQSGNNSGLKVKNNRLVNLPKVAIKTPIAEVYTTTNLEITGNLISGITGSGQSGIQVGFVEGSSTISRNKIENLAYGGILVDKAHNLLISDNEISGATQQGIQLASVCGNVTISGNTISNTNTLGTADKGGIRIYGAVFDGSVYVTNNIVSGSYNGLAVKNGENITGKSIFVNDNSFAGNSNKGIYHGGTGALNATCNWYGTYTASGVAALISGNVTYNPWLVSGTDSLPNASGFQPVPGLCIGGTSLVVAETITNVACNGASTGAIDISVNGGKTPYTYAWSGANSYSSTVQNISGLAAGTYTVTVTDDCGITATKAINITQPALVVASGLVTNVKCNGGIDGSIDLSVSGGSGSYTYLWSNGETSQDISGLIAGTYSVAITESNGCTVTGTTSFTITQPTQLTGSASVTTAISCFGGNATVTLIADGGTAPYSYSFNGVSNTTGIFTITAGTNYGWSVMDANNCGPVTGTLTVSQPAQLTGSASVTTAITCFGGNGTVTLIAGGGTVPYSYTFNGVTNTTGVFTVTAGTNYAWSVTDANNCGPVTGTLTVTQPAILTASISSTNVSCNGGNNGTISITAPSGGSGSYSYRLNNGTWQASGNFIGLSAGTYSVQIRDAVNTSCTRVLNNTLSITEPPLIVVTVVSANISCNGLQDGSISLSASGGVGVFSFNLTGPNGFNQTNATGIFLNLKAGNYTYTVKDAVNCTKSGVITIVQPAKLTVSLVLTNPACPGTNGTATFNFTGGTSPYKVTIGGTVYLSATNPLQIQATLPPTSSYTYTATDSRNCIAITGTFSFTNPTAISISRTINNVTCLGGANGSINITVTGGTSPYTFSWTGPNGFSAITEDISSLKAGTYTVTVTDSKGCINSATYTVSTVQSTAISVSISTKNNGTIFRTTVPYTQTTSILFATGQSGNFGLSSQVQLTAAAQGGNGSFTYNWAPKGGLSSTTGSQVIAKPTVTTTYTVSAKDNLGCIATADQIVVFEDLICRTTTNKAGVEMCVSGVSTCVLLSSPATGVTANTFGYCVTALPPSNLAVIQNEVEAISTNEPSLKAFPNPTYGLVNISIERLKEGKAAIRVYDANGKMVSQQDFMMVGTIKQITMDLTRKTSGIYFIEVVQGSIKLNTRIFKQ